MFGFVSVIEYNLLKKARNEMFLEKEEVAHRCRMELQKKDAEIQKAVAKQEEDEKTSEAVKLGQQAKLKAATEVAEANKDLMRVVSSLIDGTFDNDGSGDFEDLYNSLMKERDTYFVLEDFMAFREAEDKVFAAYKDQKSWAKMSLMNIAHAGIFSSDRTIQQYVDDVWKLDKVN